MSDHAQEAGHGSVKSYITGFVLAVILTVIPFWMVMTEAADRITTAWVIALFAVVQIVVHLKYFLHMNFTKEGRLQSISFVFSALIIGLVVGLSLWIMYSANDLMMAM